MNAITTTARVNLTAYSFSELSSKAQSRVFNDWLESGDLSELYRLEVEEIENALSTFAYFVDAEYRTDIDGTRVYFDDVDFYKAVENSNGADEYGWSGTCWGYDLAAAFNKRVRMLQALREKVEAAEALEQNEEPDSDGRCYGVYATMEAQNLYCLEYEAALADVAAAHRDNMNAAYEWYMEGKGAADIWYDGQYEFYTADRWYDADGRDVTELVDRYGAVVIDDDAA